MRSELVALALIIGAGCAGMQTIRRVPAKTAPEAERIAAFDELRPDYRSDKLTLTGPELRLRDGTVIWEPASLLPALEPRTPAAQMAHAYLRSSANRDAAGATALGTGAVSVALTLFTFTVNAQSEGQVWTAVMALGHAGFALVNAAVWAILAVVSGNERDALFDEYEASLRARLAIPDAR